MHNQLRIAPSIQNWFVWFHFESFRGWHDSYLNKPSSSELIECETEKKIVFAPILIIESKHFIS